MAELRVGQRRHLGHALLGPDNDEGRLVVSHYRVQMPQYLYTRIMAIPMVRQYPAFGPVEPDWTEDV